MTRIHAFAAAICLLAPTGAAAAGLLGEATYLNADDLTVIEADGRYFEFLDIRATDGVSVADALDLYGLDGFRTALPGDVANLFDAFGFAYVDAPGSYAELSVTEAQATAFVDMLGRSRRTGNSTLGVFEDPAGENGGHSYFCISTSGCTPLNFVTDTDLSGAGDGHGAVLLRETTTPPPPPPIPAPAAAPLLLGGLCALAALRRRR